MGSGEIVIDLSAAPEWLEPPERSRDRRRMLRPWLAVACVAVILTSVATSGARRVPPSDAVIVMPQVRATDRPSTFHSHTSLFIVTDDRVASYRQSDGGLRWNTATELTQLYATEERAGTVIFVGDGAPSDGAAPPVTVALDAGTGAVRWRAPGYPAYQNDAVVTVVDEIGGPKPTVIGFERSTGVPLWRVEQPVGTRIQGSFGGWRIPEAEPPGELMIMRGDHSLATIAAATGTVAEIGVLPISDISVQSEDTVIGRIFDDPDHDDSGSQDGVYVAFDRATLRELWRLPISDNDGFWLIDCGRLLCRGGGSVSGAMDWRTGQMVWTADDFIMPTVVWHRQGRDVVVGNSLHNEEIALLDGPTGAQLYRAAHGWQFAGVRGRDVVAVLPWSQVDHRPWVGVIRDDGEITLTALAPFADAGGPVNDCFVEQRLICTRGKDIIMVRLDVVGLV